MDWKQQYYEELYHHGTKGMNWGDRKYQYKDGTWTPLGKLRYSKSTREEFEDKMDPLYAKQLKSKRAVEDAGAEYEKYTTKNGKSGRKVIPGKEAEAAAAKDKLDKANAKYTKDKRAVEDAELKLKTLNKEESKARQELQDYRSTLNTQRTEVGNIVTSTKATTQGLSSIVDIANRARNQKARANSDAHTLTDAELQRAINRMNMEQNYNRLKYDGQTTRGAERAKNALEAIGGVVTVVGGALGIALAIKQLRNA